MSAPERPSWGFLVFLLLALAATTGLMVKTWDAHKFQERQQEREARYHEEWKVRHGCVHTGYFRSGRHRVYRCDDRVLVERGTRMYDNEINEYVKGY